MYQFEEGLQTKTKLRSASWTSVYRQLRKEGSRRRYFRFGDSRQILQKAGDIYVDTWNKEERRSEYQFIVWQVNYHWFFPTHSNMLSLDMYSSWRRQVDRKLCHFGEWSSGIYLIARVQIDTAIDQCIVSITSYMYWPNWLCASHAKAVKFSRRLLSYIINRI